MAEQVTTLRLSVDSREVTTAQKELQKLGIQASSTEKATNSATKAFATLSAVLGTVGVAALSREFVKIADDMNLLDARLKMVSASTAEYVAQKKELLEVSKETYSSINEITTLYTKLNPALKQIGATTKDVNNITESFAKGLKLGGANTQEAASATLQFAQAMGSGVLRGEEFNAIAEASPKLMQYLADGLGVPQTALRKLAQEGELTLGKVAAALLKMSSKIDEDFTQIPLTVGMATQNIKTDLAVAIENFDKTTGATKSLAEAISGLSVNINEYATDITTFYTNVSKFINEHNQSLRFAIGLVGGIATAYYGFIAGGAVVTGIKNITTAVYGLRRAMVVLQASSPVLLGISAALGVATAAYIAHEDTVTKKNYSSVNSIDSLVKSHEELRKKREEIKNDKFMLDKTQRKETEIIDAELKKIEARLNQIGKARSANVEKAKKEFEETAKAAKALEEAAKKQIKIEDPKAPKALKIKTQKTDAQKEAEELAREQAETAIYWAHEERQAKLIAINEITAENQKSAEDSIYWDSEIRKAQMASIGATTLERQKYNEEFEAIIASEAETINTKMLALFEANQGLWSSEQMEAFFNKWNESLDGTQGHFNSILDSIDSLSGSVADFTGSFEGLPKTIANAVKAVKNLGDVQIKVAKEREKIEGDKKLTTQEKSIALDKLKTAEVEMQYGAYANLAGAMASAFEQGSDGAIAFSALQSALGIASSWTAIANAWALPFPANIGAAAMVASQVMPIIQQLGGSGGGGIGSIAGMDTAQGYTDMAKFKADATEAITDRLDRQIKILESIDQGGTAAIAKVTLAGATFESDIAKIWADMISTDRRSKSIIVDRNINYTGNALADVQSVIEWLTRAQDKFSTTDWNWLEMDKGTVLEYKSDLEDAVSSFAMNIGEVKDVVKDSAQGFKDIYDELSGTGYYKIKELQDAFDALGNSIVGNTESSMLSYMSKAVYEMEQLGASYIEGAKSLLKEGSIDEQVAMLRELSNTFSTTFNNGAEEALNFLESIELVASAMVSSKENIRSFADSLLSESELLQNQADALGISIPKTMEELMVTFAELQKGIDGLNDAELEFLNASKDAIQERIDAESDANKKALDEENRLREEQSRSAKQAADEARRLIEEQKKRMTSLFESIIDFVEKLRGTSNTLTAQGTLDKFNTAFNDLLEGISSKADNISDLGKSAMDAATSYLDTISRTALSASDIAFARLSIASRFESTVPKGFASGGYTGDIPTSSVAGVVHGREYVVNAKTTRDLGLNNSSGLFASMNDNISRMANKIESMNNLMITQTTTQVRTLNTQRAILGEIAQ